MTVKICTTGHVMNDGDVTCPRCGAGEQLSSESNQNNTMEDENKVEATPEVANDEVAETTESTETENETVVADQPQQESAPSEEASNEAVSSESTPE